MGKYADQFNKIPNEMRIKQDGTVIYLINYDILLKASANAAATICYWLINKLMIYLPINKNVLL